MTSDPITTTATTTTTTAEETVDRLRRRVVELLREDLDGGGAGMRTWEIRTRLPGSDKRYLRGTLEGLVRDGLVSAQPIVYQRLSGVIWSIRADSPIAHGSQ